MIDRVGTEVSKDSARYITKPIQLWAAWLIGLTTLVGIFLGTAIQFQPSWERTALVLAAIIYVPTFLLIMAVLQTRFRAELQEDSYYSQMVTNRKTDEQVSLSRFDTLDAKIEQLREVLLPTKPTVAQIPELKEVQAATDWESWKVALNIHFPDYQLIKRKLEAESIPVSVAFGSDKPPKKWIVAISEHIPKPMALSILVPVSTLGFDGFVFWSPIREVGETEDVYIGSYGHDNYIKFDASFSESVKDEFSFSAYILKHQQAVSRS